METQENLQAVKKKDKLNFVDAKYGTGKRKKSIARVWLKKGSGNVFINGKKMEEYFTTANLQMIVSRPLAVISSGSPGPAPTRKTFPVGLSTFFSFSSSGIKLT